MVMIEGEGAGRDTGKVRAMCVIIRFHPAWMIIFS
jgi:hypothetical protein